MTESSQVEGVTEEELASPATTSYAMSIADSSYHWYRTAAIRSRRLYRASEIAVLIASALIPLSAATFVGNTVVPAALGAIIVLVSGLRSSFQWHENYLRFNQAREAVEGERRKYRIGVSPYASPNREVQLVSNVSAIESQEMGRWLEAAGNTGGDSARQLDGRPTAAETEN